MLTDIAFSPAQKQKTWFVGVFFCFSSWCCLITPSLDSTKRIGKWLKREQTEETHNFLFNHLIQQNANLHRIRFGLQTWYCILDHSCNYHENTEFRLRPAHLKAFPNSNGIERAISLFNANSLLLAIASYSLGSGFQPIWSSQQNFAHTWSLITKRKILQRSMLKLTLRASEHANSYSSVQADKFIYQASRGLSNQTFHFA